MEGWSLLSTGEWVEAFRIYVAELGWTGGFV